MRVALKISLADYAKEQDITFAQLARRAGLARSTVAALDKRESYPSGTAIAGLITATKMPFPKLFVIEKAS